MTKQPMLKLLMQVTSWKASLLLQLVRPALARSFISRSWTRGCWCAVFALAMMKFYDLRDFWISMCASVICNSIIAVMFCCFIDCTQKPQRVRVLFVTVGSVRTYFLLFGLIGWDWNFCCRRRLSWDRHHFNLSVLLVNSPQIAYQFVLFAIGAWICGWRFPRSHHASCGILCALKWFYWSFAGGTSLSRIRLRVNGQTCQTQFNL